MIAEDTTHAGNRIGMIYAKSKLKASFLLSSFHNPTVLCKLPKDGNSQVLYSSDAYEPQWPTRQYSLKGAEAALRSGNDQ